MEMGRLTRDGTAEPVSRDQILRRERGQGIIAFPGQLTTSRNGNLTRLILTLTIYDDLTYVHTRCTERNQLKTGTRSEKNNRKSRQKKTNKNSFQRRSSSAGRKTEDTNIYVHKKQTVNPTNLISVVER